MTDETTRAVMVALIVGVPSTITSVGAILIAYWNTHKSDAILAQSEKNAHSIEQVRAATSLTTDRTGTLTFSVNELQKKLAEIAKK